MYIGSWQWVDFGNIPSVLDYVGFLIGGAGIGFTVVQLMKSRSALDAAAKALKDTRGTLMQNQLLAILPRFKDVYSRLDKAIELDQRNEVESALSHYCGLAGEAIVLMQSSVPTFDVEQGFLKSSVDIVSAVRSLLYSDRLTDLRDLVESAATSIREIEQKVVAVTVTVQNDAGRSANA